MKKTTTKKVEVEVEKKPAYSASIKIFGKAYTSSGESVMESLTNLDPGRNARGVAVLTVTKNDVVREKILTGPQTMRLFSLSRMMREVALKQVSNLFDNL